MNKRLLVGVLAVLAVGASACGSSQNSAATAPTVSPGGTGGSGNTGNTGTAPPPTSVAPPTTISVRAGMVAWYSAHGTVFQTLTTDVGAVTTDAGNTDYTSLGSDCQTFGNDVSTALGYEPMPDPSIETPWRAALTDYQHASNECVQGANTLDASQLDSAATDLDAGNGQVQATLTAVNSFTS